MITQLFQGEYRYNWTFLIFMYRQRYLLLVHTSSYCAQALVIARSDLYYLKPLLFLQSICWYYISVSYQETMHIELWTTFHKTRWAHRLGFVVSHFRGSRQTILIIWYMRMWCVIPIELLPCYYHEHAICEFTTSRKLFWEARQV